MGFPNSITSLNKIFFVASLIVILCCIESLTVQAIHYGRHYHHHHHHRPHHKCRWPSLHHLPASATFWPDTTDSNRFDSDHLEYAPLKLEYTLPADIDNQKTLFEPGSLYHEKNIAIPYQLPSWDDKHSNVFRIKRIRNKKKQKKILKPIKDIYYPEIFENTTPNYSIVNKIIVIEEPDSHIKSKGENDPNVEKHIVKSILDSKLSSNRENSNFLNQKQIPRFPIEQPLVNQSPILTINDLHNRLNQTLLNARVPSDGNKKGSEAINQISNGTLVIPPVLNTTFQTSDGGAILTKYSNQDFFIKSNNFAFQNNWSYITSTESSHFKINGTKSNDQLVSSGSTNRQWLSSTNPPVVYFTSQRSPITIRPSLTNVRKMNKFQTVETSSERNLEFSAAKRGGQLDDNKTINETALEIGKLGSIIFAFCISMMLLAGIIVVILHKNTVSEHFRNFTERNQSNEQSNVQQSSGSGSSEAPSNPAPPPPKLNQHLIEQIIGNPDNSFNNKKCRHYFSRVHRWVPKRPPLPSDLVIKDQKS